MIHWIRGQLEASFVGEPSQLVLPRSDKNERRHQLTLYRAAVTDVVSIAAPPDARPPIVERERDAPEEPATDTNLLEPFEQQHIEYRQPRVEQAHVSNIRGGGTFFLGALFDLRVSDVRLTFPTEKAGRSYGMMTGTVVACVVLPPEPAPEHVPASELVQSAPLPPVAPGQLHIVPDVTQAESPATEQELPALPTPRRTPALLPSLALAAVVCLALALQCGALPALLWSVFMLPTLVARRLFVGMLPDTRGIHIVGAVLVAIQLACTASLLGAWWSASCRELLVLPLLGVIVVLFPAGLLPSPIPLVCNAISLAAILFGWCTHARSAACLDSTSADTAPPSSTATEH